MKTVIEMAREAGFSLYRDISAADGSFAHLERFAELVRADERKVCSQTRAGKPRELKPVGRGTLLDEQQYCFDKGWREGAASVRAAIRTRGNT